MALCLCIASLHAQLAGTGIIAGTVRDTANEPMEHAHISLKNTKISEVSDKNGDFALNVPAGTYVLCVKYIGYRTYEQPIEVETGGRQEIRVALEEEPHSLDEIVIPSKSTVRRINESAFNVVAIDARALHNSTLDLAHAMARISGVKLRESGGLGSELHVSLNGFTGRHVKFFMDGTPMEGMGAGFQINNIPINMAERIEVYKGVVPVGFGADAIGGVVNIVTVRNRTFVDASYSYGSFNTHRSSVNASHVTKSGILMEINAFQNYSDNSYRIHNAVKDLESGQIDTEKAEDVKRFHDTYHNETVIAKFGLVDKSFADRLVFGFNAGRTYKELQNGVRQDVVFGQKHNRGTNIMPSMVYLKRDFLTDGLNVNLTANYNRNIMMNIDTATYEYNWRGESRYNNGKRGEQSYQESEYENRNWNSTFTAHYKIGKHHYFTLNDVFTSFDRNTRATASDASAVATDTMPKVSNKNVLGAEYRLNYSARWNVSVFAKHYAQFSRGPKDISEDTGHVKYGVFSETFTATGYGIAGTYFWKDFQGKISYEKTYRLPTDSELFGDEELEKGSTGLKAENSNNYNLNISYGRDFDDHYVFIDAGFMLRNTKDYIRRVTDSYSNKYYASHINHGYVRNIGFNGEARYSYKNMISAGVNLTSQNIRDNEKLTVNTSGSSTYGSRIPNIPYFFVNGDLSLSWNNFLKRGNHLSLGYASSYVHSFPLYSEKHGAVGKMHVPSQFSHDLQLAYTVRNGRYNVSVECRNFTNERLYDNFSLQKPGRAFYIKLRYFLN